MLIGKECPVCRVPLHAVRTFFRPAWSRWRCDACGSLIAISTMRRMLAIGIWIAVMVVWMYLMRQSPAPQTLSLVGLGVLCFVTIAVIDRVVVVERAGLHCAGCGYDLQQSSGDHCAECGDEISAELLARRARILEPPSIKSRRSVMSRIALVVAVALLGLTLLLVGLTKYRNATGAPPAPPAGGTQPTD